MIRAGTELFEIRQVRQAALRRVQTRSLFLFLRSLRNEARSLDDYDDWGGSKGLRANLTSLYRSKLRQIKSDLERALEVSTREVAEEMLTTEEQVNLLEYEVGQAIFQRVSDTGGGAKARKKAAKVPVSSERVYYRFNGEYWTDELPRYKFNIEDRCVD